FHLRQTVAVQDQGCRARLVVLDLRAKVDRIVHVIHGTVPRKLGGAISGAHGAERTQQSHQKLLHDRLLDWALGVIGRMVDSIAGSNLRRTWCRANAGEPSGTSS